MKAEEVVNEIITSDLIDRIPKRRKVGRKGYNLELRLKLLVYAFLKGIHSNRALVLHLQNNPQILTALGFKSCPGRRTIDRWKKSIDEELHAIITLLGDKYIELNNPEWSIYDSTPIKDEQDKDGKIGYNSEGMFKGFKLHLAVDKLGIPLRAEFTTANTHDCKVADKLLVCTKKSCADAGYDSKDLKKFHKSFGFAYFLAIARKSDRIIQK